MSSSESGEEYEVESIRGRRLRKGKLQYLLRWKGYEEQTWTDKEDCGCDALIRAFEAQRGRDGSDADATILVTPRKSNGEPPSSSRKTKEDKSTTPEVVSSSRRSRSGVATTSSRATKTPKSNDRSRSTRSAGNGRRSVKSDQTLRNEAKRKEEKRKSRIASERKRAEEERHETSSDEEEVERPTLRMRKKSTAAISHSRSSSHSSGDERMARLHVRRKKAAPVSDSSSSTTTTTPEKSPKKANSAKSKAHESSTTTSSSSNSPVKSNLKNKKTAPVIVSSSSTTTTPDQTPKKTNPKAAPVVVSSSSSTTTPDERSKRTNTRSLNVSRSVVTPKKKKEATPEDDLSGAESEDSALSIQFVGIRRSPIKRAPVDLVNVDESTPEPEEEEKEEEESKRATRSAGTEKKVTAAAPSSSRRRRTARDEEEEEEEKEEEPAKRRRMSILENSGKKSIKRAASPIHSPREKSMERGVDGEIILPSIQSPKSGLTSPGLSSSPITLKDTLAAVLKAIPAVDVLRELEKTDRAAAAAAAKVLEQSTIALGPEDFPKFRVWTRAAYEEWMAKNEKGADFLTHNDGPGSERFLGRKVEGIVGYVARGSVPFCLVKSDIKGAGKLPLQEVIIGVETTLAAKILTKSFTAFTTNLVYLQQLAASIVQKSDEKQVEGSQNTSNGIRRTRRT